MIVVTNGCVCVLVRLTLSFENRLSHMHLFSGPEKQSDKTRLTHWSNYVQSSCRVRITISSKTSSVIVSSLPSVMSMKCRMMKMTVQGVLFVENWRFYWVSTNYSRTSITRNMTWPEKVFAHQDFDLSNKLQNNYDTEWLNTEGRRPYPRNH